MKEFKVQQSQTIADEIVAYLNKHPDAADTLDGIVHWWLIRQRYLFGLTQVQAALDRLVADGLIQETLNRDRGKVYSAAKGR